MAATFAYAEVYGHPKAWEVLMKGLGDRKSYMERRLCLCTHEDDAKVIAETMEKAHQEIPPDKVYEYYYKTK